MHQPFPRGKVYFEKQSDDRLCGLHCVNNLLQGPFYDMISLSEIGVELDKLEQQLTGVNSQNNVDDSGNYNIQVIERALKKLGCEIQSLRKREAITKLQNNMQIEALIFNSSTHWFSIRKIDNIWFNLNSTNKLPGPEIITDFYLSAFIQGTEDAGYSNFLVTKLPKLLETNALRYSSLMPHQHLVDYSAIIEAKEQKQQKKKMEEDERKRKEEEEKQKFQPFSGQGFQVDQYYDQFYSQNQGHEQYENDDEMKLAMQLSLQSTIDDIRRTLPPEPKTGGFFIKINYEDKSFSRRFNDDDTIHDVKKFVQTQIPTVQPVQLFEPFPRVFLDDEYVKLKDEKRICRNQILMSRILQ